MTRRTYMKRQGKAECPKCSAWFKPRGVAIHLHYCRKRNPRIDIDAIVNGTLNKYMTMPDWMTKVISNG